MNSQLIVDLEEAMINGVVKGTVKGAITSRVFRCVNLSLSFVVRYVAGLACSFFGLFSIKNAQNAKNRWKKRKGLKRGRGVRESVKIENIDTTDRSTASSCLS
jgi:hypothetical protein